MSGALDHRHLRRYLDLLGVSHSRADWDALNTLVAAHLARVPFENISKLYYRKSLGFTGLPPLEMFLDGVERFHFGGTCYANNFHFYSLLAALGYEARLCSADMSNPDVHAITIVKWDGREYIVDVGYAAPFLAPLPRDLDREYELSFGADRYLLKPQDEQGRSRLELYRNGALAHAYIAKPAARNLEHFAPAIAASFRPDATFMNAVLLARFARESSLVIHNLSVIETRGKTSRVQQLADARELARAIETHFGIPQAIVCDVVEDLPGWCGAWG